MNIQRISAQTNNKNVNFKSKLVIPKPIEYEIENLKISTNPVDKALYEKVSGAINKIKDSNLFNQVTVQRFPLGFTLDPRCYTYRLTADSGKVIAQKQYCNCMEFLSHAAEKF